MDGCRPTDPRAAPAERGGDSVGATPSRRPRGDESFGRRFCELLSGRRRDAEEATRPAGAPAPDPDPTWTVRLCAASARESPATPASGRPATAAPPVVSLTDVCAAAGADGAALRFTIDDGFLAGSRMAFLLRGDALEIAVEAPAGEVLDRLRAREDEMRAALASRGLELERFETGRGGREETGTEGEDDRASVVVRRARERRRTQGEREV